MSKHYLKTGLVEVSKTIDSETGEVLDVETVQHKYVANTKEEFFFGYSALIGAFRNMTQAEIRVFGYCLNFAWGNQFDISKNVRVAMSSIINVNERVIANTVKKLVSDKVLLRDPVTKLYFVNPRFAFKGTATQRNSALKAVIELDYKGGE